MARRGVCLAGVLLLAAMAGPTHADSGQSDISPAAYARLKRVGVSIELAANAARSERWMSAALALRPHSGDRSLLMGCDLFDPELSAERAHLERLASSASYEAYAVGERRLADLARALSASGPDAVASDPGDLETRIASAHAADQTARNAYGSPPPAGFEDLADATLQLRMDAACRLDLAHTDLVELAVEALADLPQASQRQTYVLAMHADHDPGLQARAADAFAGLPGAATAFASLRDRSELNFGRAQIYGRLYGCDGDPLRPDGPAVELAEVDRRRAILGLPSFMAEAGPACAAYRP